MNSVSNVCTITAAVLALASAFFWWRSAARSIPAPMTYWDAMPEDAPFIVAVRATARDNAIAAALAGLAAAIGAAGAILPIAGH